MSRPIIALTAASLVVAVYLVLPPAPSDSRGPQVGPDLALDTTVPPLVTDAWRKVPVPSAEPAPTPSTIVVVSPEPRREVAQDLMSVPPDRASIARELQAELKRAGCYGGEINGAWTTPTRRAMEAFLQRANAQLPAEQPDVFLLSLVRGRQGIVCGSSCPAGQSLARDEQCVPDAILARPKADPGVAAVTGWTTSTTTAMPAPAPGEAPMALAGPKGEPPKPSAAPPQKQTEMRARFGPEIFKQLDRMGSN